MGTRTPDAVIRTELNSSCSDFVKASKVPLTLTTVLPFAINLKHLGKQLFILKSKTLKLFLR